MKPRIRYDRHRLSWRLVFIDTLIGLTRVGFSSFHEAIVYLRHFYQKGWVQR